MEPEITYREYTRETQRRRRERLDNAAKSIGFSTWGKFETAVINGEFELYKTKRMPNEQDTQE